MRPGQRVSQLKDKVAQKETFASPAEAGAALLDAAQSADHGALLALFGPGAKDLSLLFGEDINGKNSLQDFVAAYNQMHRWREIKVGGEMLYVGADNYIFPIPLGQNPAGQWYFDTAAGNDEILARRIGKNELAAIAACGFAYDAETQYHGQTHDNDKVRQYAQKFVSDEGKQNGLYWPPADGEALRARSRKFVSSRKPPVTPRPATIRIPSTATGSEY